MAEKKKYSVCHLLYEEFPRDPRVRRYVNILNNIGFHCIIICSKKKNEKSFEELNGNLIYRLPVAKKRSSFFITLIEYLIFTSVSSWLLIYLKIRYGFKIVHTHTLPDFLIFAALPVKILGCKLILDLHEIFPELFIARKPDLEKSFYVSLLKTAERWSIKIADKVLTIHDNARNIFIGRNKNIENKIEVLMNSIDPSEFTDTLLNPTGEFVIIYNGSIVKLLNLTLVVKAIAKLKEQISENDFAKIKFKLYGEGPDLENILIESKQLNIENSVVYEGSVSPKVMYEEVRKANVCVLPPIKNIYSDLFYTLKMLEMIYLRIPVIATRLNTYQKYYREDSLFYFDSGDLDGLAEQIKKVFYEKDLVKQKTENAFIDYQKVGWDIMKERYIKVINGLLQH